MHFVLVEDFPSLMVYIKTRVVQTFWWLKPLHLPLIDLIDESFSCLCSTKLCFGPYSILSISFFGIIFSAFTPVLQKIFKERAKPRLADLVEVSSYFRRFRLAVLFVASTKRHLFINHLILLLFG